ncbi:putative transporter yoaV [Acrasis kona]|uniref:Transporter yoaV n=1 Tax=Acrasis kona TaxID=1008807 RepID=A0AAW2Z699_9EUKA
MTSNSTPEYVNESQTTVLIPEDPTKPLVVEQAQPNLNWTLPSFLIFILLGAVWGSAFLFIKVAIDEKTGFPPLTMVMLRLLMATVLMGMYLAFQMARDKELRAKINKNRSTGTILKFFVMGFFNNAIPFALVGLAEQTINTGITSILDSTIPLFGVVLGHFFLKGERMNLLKVVGLIVGFGGVVLVCLNQVYGSDKKPNARDIFGYVAVTGASASYAVASTFSRKYLKEVPGAFASFGQIASAAIMLVICSLVWDLGISERHYFFFRHASLYAWLSILYLAFCSTLIAYLCYFYLIRTVGSVKQTMVGYLLPVFGVFEGAVFLGEWKGLAWYYILCEIVGALLICGGIAVASLPSFSVMKSFIKVKLGRKQIEDDVTDVVECTETSSLAKSSYNVYSGAGESSIQYYDKK